MRGKENTDFATAYFIRITPACAGKSALLSRYLFQRWDHPRVCGEKEIFPAFTINLLGSPPRVRGKGYQESTLYHQFEITPACAGKSFLTYFITLLTKDHPRVCGEKPIVRMDDTK